MKHLPLKPQKKANGLNHSPRILGQGSPQTNAIKTYFIWQLIGMDYLGGIRVEIEGHFLCIKIPLAFEQFAHRFEILYCGF